MATGGVFLKSTGDTIFAADYNVIQSVIAGVKTTFYGVATASASVTAGVDIITAAHWNNLKTDIDACIKHQTGSNTSLTTKLIGDLIYATDINPYYTDSGNAVSNEITVYSPTQLALVANQATSSRNGIVRPWNTSISHTVQVDWSTAAEATYFFNCGGSLIINAGDSGGTGGSKDLDWANIISRIGTISFTRTNWLAGGTQVIATVYGGSVNSVYGGGPSVYGPANYYQVSVTVNSGSQLTINIIFNDASTHHVDENVGLTITSSVGYYKSVDAIVSPVPSAFTTLANL